MHLHTTVPSDCSRVRQQVSAYIDLELSEFEQAATAAHLRRCAECSSFAEQLLVIAQTLRSEPLAEPSCELRLPRARRRSRLHVARAIPAAAAVAVVAMSGLVGLRAAESPVALRNIQAHELASLKEQQLEQLAPAIPADPPRHGVLAAEGTTLVPEGGPTGP